MTTNPSIMKTGNAGLVELRERIRQARGHDFTLDAAIAVGCGATRYRKNPHWIAWPGDPDNFQPALNYTFSIDAALALVERVLPGCGIVVDILSNAEMIGMNGRRPKVTATLAQSEAEWTYDGWPTVAAKTAPLAILDACLSALIAKAAGSGEVG